MTFNSHTIEKYYVVDFILTYNDVKVIEKIKFMSRIEKNPGHYTTLAPYAILCTRFDRQPDNLEKTVKYRYPTAQYCSCPGVHRGKGSSSALYERKVCV
jgi:hypothetical protein